MENHALEVFDRDQLDTAYEVLTAIAGERNNANDDVRWHVAIAARRLVHDAMLDLADRQYERIDA